MFESMSLSLNGANGFGDQQTKYPFLEHIPRDTPEGEASSSSRQKRRRTSPQDHAKLEAAYQRNSKPDKQERIEIVSQVELGEKEVQIWFQNRRQTDRRKSRPLLPHELVPHFRNGVPIEVLQHSVQSDGPDHEVRSQPLYVSSTGQDYNEELVHSRASSINELLNPAPSSESKADASTSSSQEHVRTGTSPLSSFELVEEHSHRTEKGTSSDTRSEQEEKTSSGRKRAHAEMMGSMGPLASTTALPPPKVPSHGSTVRLSMTAEGAVKIRTTEQETPSPPKERALAPDVRSRRSSGLQRSKSAIEMGAHSSPLLANPKVADGKLGRSRDARTWEFYCDSEARDTLSSHAEYERNGSAVGAINLIRSQSQRQLRQMLAPVTSRSNTRAPAPLGSNAQRSKPKLARAKSLLADLDKIDGKTPRPQVARSPSGDSDKENWAPGSHTSQHPLRRSNISSNDSPVLTENHSMLSYASGLDRQGNRDARRIDGKEHRKPLSMGLKEKGSDLDCVQGLLSLSQGAWR